ncbi:chymotrypsin-like protease CTRL-1 [Garra rufa]|uniref:chymotrypsin-like protease CTRL-1 n=1 Tax=Garra rufa TaxID=137080 RepID=UPI003CCEB29E
MKFNTALSVAGVILLNITGSLCQLNVCGRTSRKDRIVGGNNATVGSWPWQVSIHCGKGHICGGTLINKDWVLSAAHCFKETPCIFKMYFGLLNQTSSSHSETRTARRILSHPNYDSATYDNDIALIELSSSVTFLYNTSPVCLAAANSTFAAGTESWVTGWGFLQFSQNPDDKLLSDKLQEVMLPVVSNSDCENAYKSTSSITDNMICAGWLNQEGKDACQCDSGGPMVINNGFLWIQSGIVSCGEGCGDPEYPGVYTRVSQYQKWIESSIGTNLPGFVVFNSASDSNFRSVPDLLLFPFSLTFSIIPLTFSNSVAP